MPTQSFASFVTSQIGLNQIYVTPKDFYNFAKTHPLCVEVVAYQYGFKKGMAIYHVFYTHPTTKAFICHETTDLDKLVKLCHEANDIIFNNNLITIAPYQSIGMGLEPVIKGSQTNLDKLSADYLKSINNEGKEIFWGLTDRAELNVLIGLY